MDIDDFADSGFFRHDAARAFSELAGHYLQTAARRLSRALLDQYALSLQAPASEESLRKARAAADRHASTLITNLGKAEIRKIGQRLADGIVDGLHPRKIAESLSEVRGLDRIRAKRFENYKVYLEVLEISDEVFELRLERFYQRMLRERKETIARTEARYATSEARRIAAAQRGVRWKSWVTNGDERVSDVCAGNEAMGVIPYEQAFVSGVDQPPGHPNCRCTVVYVATERVRELEEERAEERILATMRARESFLEG